MTRAVVSLIAVRDFGTVIGYSVEQGIDPEADITVRDADVTAVGHPSNLRAIDGLEPAEAAAVLRARGFAARKRTPRARTMPRAVLLDQLGPAAPNYDAARAAHEAGDSRGMVDALLGPISRPLTREPATLTIPPPFDMNPANA